ncbi:hypothetical protein HanIR_Chr15g0734021 [Helianthus annuus]|nr:hypothetical protein HanIR_Chr15g0734021 [Helianthus annuus]
MNRNIEIEDIVFPLCGSKEELSNHLFTSCMVASRVWHYISRWCKIALFIVHTVRELLDLYDHVGLQGVAKEIFHGIVLISCWSIRRARNGVKFSNSQVRVEDIINEIKSIGFLWCNSRLKARSLSWTGWCNFVIM